MKKKKPYSAHQRQPQVHQEIIQEIIHQEGENVAA